MGVGEVSQWAWLDRTLREGSWIFVGVSTGSNTVPFGDEVYWGVSYSTLGRCRTGGREIGAAWSLGHGGEVGVQHVGRSLP